MRLRRRFGSFERLEDRRLLIGTISQIDFFETWNAGIIPSTDVAGLTYHAGKLYLADSEINENSEFQGQNIFATNTAGDQLLDQIDASSNEPTGITHNAHDGFFYVTNDDADRIYRYDASLSSPLTSVNPTSDVPGAGDPEGITSDPATGFLYVADGVGGTRRVLVYDSNLVFQNSFFVGDRVQDPEGIAFHPLLNNLFIVSSPDEKVFEYTVNGSFIEEYDISSFSPAPQSAQGATFAPTSDPFDDPNALALYIADLGFDNHPDGGVYEALVSGGGMPQNQVPEVDVGADQTIALPAVAVLNATVNDDGLPNPPGLTTINWSQVSGPAGVVFADPGAASTTASFPTDGTYVLRATVDDGDLIASDELTVTVQPAGTSIIFETQIATTSDDVEEKPSGSVSLTSRDLDMVVSGSNLMTVGMRFTGVSIPQGASINHAYIQFQADEVSSGVANLTIEGQADDDAATFSTVSGNVSGRTRTNAAVLWTPDPWDAVGDAGPAQQTAEIAPIIQEIVDRPGWSSGNALVAIVTGSGKRTAESFDSIPAAAPVLHVEYSVASGDRPIVTATASTLNYTENGGPVVIDPSLTVTDADSTHLEGATVVISSGDLGQELLGFVDQNGISGSFSGDTLLLAGTAPVEDYQAALRSITYENTSDQPSPSSRTVTFSASDGNGVGSGSRDIVISAVNDPPVVTASPSTLDYSVGAGPVAVDSNIMVNDVDDLTLTGATVTLGGGVVSEDQLAFLDQNGITGSFAGTTLTLSGTASVAEYEAALRSVTYENTNTVDPDTSPRTITFTVFDAQTSGAASRDISISDTPVTNQVFEARVAVGADDAEENPSGRVGRNSSDLELGDDQTVGIRIVDVSIPRGATILDAHLQFQVDETSSGTALLTIAGQDADHAPAFSTTSGDISSRPTTSNTVPWSPSTWTTVGEAGPQQQTPDLQSIIQEIISRPGWSSGNALVLIVTGTGTRTAESFNGDANGAPLLHIEYSTQTLGNQPPAVAAGSNESVILPAAASLDGQVADDGLPNPPGSVTTTWSQVSGTPGVVFADPNAVNTTVTFPAAGSYVLRLTAHDGELVNSDDVTITVLPQGGTVTLERRISSGSDDAEEKASGSVGISSSDLELGDRQTVGLRFAGIAVPAGATIVNAYIQFQVDEATSSTVNLAIQGQAADDASAFNTSANNVSSRPRTSTSVPWSPAGWNTVGEAGVGQQTPDLAAVIQEIVGRPGWTSGNALALIISVTGSGKRVAESYNGKPSAAPLLHLEYVVDGS